MTQLRVILGTLMVLAIGASSPHATDRGQLVDIGTQGSGPGRGIFAVRFDPGRGSQLNLREDGADPIASIGDG